MVKPTSVRRADEPTFPDVRKWFDENLDAEKCDLDDQEVYENVYHAGRWAGIFQFTERGSQNFIKSVKPRSINDIAAATSIFRPGPLMANVDKAFIADKERVERGEKLEYVHPIVERVLSKSYGHMVYQESFMTLGRELGNLSWEDCDKLRKILVKKSIGTDVNEKKAKDALAIKERFMAGAVENGMKPEQVEELWKKMEFFSGYGFNLCLQQDTCIVVCDENGENLHSKRIADIRDTDYVITRDEQSRTDIVTRVIANHDNGVRSVNRYTFSDGSYVDCTPEHKFRTTCGKMLPISQIVEQNLDVVSVNHDV